MTKYQVFALPQSIIAIYTVKNGFGRNIYYLQSHSIENTVRYIFICEMLQIIGTSLIRVSVCIFILRMLSGAQRGLHVWIYGLLVFFAIVSLGNLLAIAFQCIPLRASWDKSIKGRCISTASLTRLAKAQGGNEVQVESELC